MRTMNGVSGLARARTRKTGNADMRAAAATFAAALTSVSHLGCVASSSMRVASSPTALASCAIARDVVTAADDSQAAEVGELEEVPAVTLGGRGVGGEGKVTGGGGRVAGDAAELEACLSGSHVPLDHRREDLAVDRGACRAFQRAVLDDRDGSVRIAEHETCLRDAAEQRPDTRSARRDGRASRGRRRALRRRRSGSRGRRRVRTRVAAAAPGRHERQGHEQGRSPTIRPPERRLRSRPTAVPVRLHESVQGSRPPVGDRLVARRLLAFDPNVW